MPLALVREPTSDQAPVLAAEFICKPSDSLMVASVYVAGKLDRGTAPQLERTLAELRARIVVLDLRDLTSIDFEGVRVIWHATIRARRGGRRLAAIRGPIQVDEVFAQIGASEVVEIVTLEPAEPTVQALLGLARAEVG